MKTMRKVAALSLLPLLSGLTFCVGADPTFGTDTPIYWTGCDRARPRKQECRKS